MHNLVDLINYYPPPNPSCYAPDARVSGRAFCQSLTHTPPLSGLRSSLSRARYDGGGWALFGTVLLKDIICMPRYIHTYYIFMLFISFTINPTTRVAFDVLPQNNIYIPIDKCHKWVCLALWTWAL